VRQHASDRLCQKKERAHPRGWASACRRSVRWVTVSIERSGCMARTSAKVPRRATSRTVAAPAHVRLNDVRKRCRDDIRTPDRPRKRGCLKQFVPLPGGLRVQHTDRNVQLASHDLDRGCEIRIVAHHDRRLEGSKVGQVHKLRRQIHVGSFLAHAHSQGKPRIAIFRCSQAHRLPSEPELPEPQHEAIVLRNGAVIRVLCAGVAAAGSTLHEQRCVEAHLPNVVPLWVKHPLAQRNWIDPPLTEPTRHAVMEVQPVDEHRCAARHRRRTRRPLLRVHAPDVSRPIVLSPSHGPFSS